MASRLPYPNLIVPQSVSDHPSRSLIRTLLRVRWSDADDMFFCFDVFVPPNTLHSRPAVETGKYAIAPLFWPPMSVNSLRVGSEESDVALVPRSMLRIVLSRIDKGLKGILRLEGWIFFELVFRIWGLCRGVDDGRGGRKPGARCFYTVMGVLGVE